MKDDLSSFASLTGEVIRQAEELVRPHVAPTPQIRWPLIEQLTGKSRAVWIKHDNHLPTGAFKVRGGLCYLHWLRRSRPDAASVLAATRGNHGQSVAFAAAVHGLPCRIVVPRGNSPAKNAAMRAYGAELIEEGEDFQAALDHASRLADEDRTTHFVPSFDWRLASGTAIAGWEFFQAVPDLDTLYVPIGLGSGICGAAAARRALGLRKSLRLAGVVAANAPAYARSFLAGKPMPSEEVPLTVADGVACRVPNVQALEVILKEVDRIVEVTEEEIRQAMRLHYDGTHQVAEGAAALPLAALLKDLSNGRADIGQRIGLMQTGGNLDSRALADILAG